MSSSSIEEFCRKVESSEESQAIENVSVSPCGVRLHEYQVAGIRWIINRLGVVAGVILADDMGLGKTIQSLSVIRYYAKDVKKASLPCLVLCPLSVSDQWVSQANRFFPELRVMLYVGDMSKRTELRESLLAESSSSNGCPVHLIITTYEIVMADSDFLSMVKWNLLVVDEAHRLKNSKTILYEVLVNKYQFKKKLLLTGTPVQNRLSEFFSLLVFLIGETFKVDNMSLGKDITDRVCHALILRRLASEVSLKIPVRTEYIIKVPLTPIQRKLYKWLLSYKQNSMNNLMTALRKVCGHPYLIPGVEPEPFEEGDHLWMNSAKLIVLKELLLAKQDHTSNDDGSKWLIFSGSTQLLDAVQDFLTLIDIDYKRVDGSIRGEDRTRAVEEFKQENKTRTGLLVFLLSTRAGGLGLNLEVANNVVLLDSDWNPHADRQAIARAHRQGQTRPVNVYRIICKDTVDEYVYLKAQAKLKISASLLGEEKTLTEEQLKNVIAYGLSKLRLVDDASIEDPLVPPVAPRLVQLPSEDMTLDKLLSDAEKKISSSLSSTNEDKEEEETAKGYKAFEGVDYNELKTEQFDRKMLDSFGVSGSSTLSAAKAFQRDKRTSITKEEKETIARLTAEKREQRKIDKWRSAGYSSLAVKETDTIIDVLEEGSINHLHGDVTDPKLSSRGKAVILFCIDDSGKWPPGGLAKSIASSFPNAHASYTKAKEMFDLHATDVHVLPGTENDAISLAFAVCVDSVTHAIKLDHFKACLKRLGYWASLNKADIHTSRIGEQRGAAGKSSLFYSVERLMKTYICSAYGLDCSIYYHSSYNVLSDTFVSSGDGNVSVVSERKREAKEEGGGSFSSCMQSKRPRIIDEFFLKQNASTPLPVTKKISRASSLAGVFFYVLPEVHPEFVQSMITQRMVSMGAVVSCLIGQANIIVSSSQPDFEGRVNESCTIRDIESLLVKIRVHDGKGPCLVLTSRSLEYILQNEYFS